MITISYIHSIDSLKSALFFVRLSIIVVVLKKESIFSKVETKELVKENTGPLWKRSMPLEVGSPGRCKYEGPVDILSLTFVSIVLE